MAFLAKLGDHYVKKVVLDVEFLGLNTLFFAVTIIKIRSFDQSGPSVLDTVQLKAKLMERDGAKGSSKDHPCTERGRTLRSK